MPSNTTTYNFFLPTVGGDTNLWGGYLNSNWEDVEDLLDGTSDIARISVVDTGNALIDTENGLISLGKSTAGVSIDALSKTDALGLPVGDTSERPGTPAEGMIRRNSETSLFEGYDGSSWGSLGGAGLFKGENGESGDTVAGAGDIFRVHEQTLNTDTTIDADENAVAAGPLTVASGVTLTVTNGGNLAIV